MHARFLREKAAAELRSDILSNLHKYRTDGFNHLLVDDTLSFETTIEFDENIVSELYSPSGKVLYEVENSLIVFKMFPDLTPYVAADERFWTMLSHTVLLPHARVRWPIPSNDEKAIKHIAAHWFARNQRQLERDNVGSRLWWMAKLCSRVDDLPLEKTLAVFLRKADVRANLVERPTTALSIPVFRTVIAALAKSFDGKGKLFERGPFRRLMVKLNGLGGYTLLDALEPRVLETTIEKIIKNDLKLSSV